MAIKTNQEWQPYKNIEPPHVPLEERNWMTWSQHNTKFLCMHAHVHTAHEVNW